MNYEEFEARANSAFDDCSEMKRMLWNMQTVVAAVPDMVRKNERLEKEKAELKAEIERLKSEVPGDCMRLPLDADGVPIRLGDEVWYVGISTEITNDDPLEVAGLVPVFDIDETYIVTRDHPGKAIAPHLLTHKQPEPPDSWEKLEEDARKIACEYACAPLDKLGMTTCDGCRFQKHDECYQGMMLDVLKRAKKLAGIEEEMQR